MASRAIRIALLLSSLPLAGCGTVASQVSSRSEEGKPPFGGVNQDLACIKKAANGELGFRTHPKSESEQYPQVALMLFCAADLPFSCIGDAVLWPYTVVYNYINQPIPIPPVTQAILPPPATQPMPMPIPIPPVAQATTVSQPKTSP
jgi:uncharacterized protein YceK